MYLARMSQPSQWGDHMILRAMSNMLGRHIIVCNVRSDGEVSQHEIVPMDDSTSDRENLYLGHLGEFHYMSLRPKDWDLKWLASRDTYYKLQCLLYIEHDSKSILSVTRNLIG